MSNLRQYNCQKRIYFSLIAGMNKALRLLIICFESFEHVYGKTKYDKPSNYFFFPQSITSPMESFLFQFCCTKNLIFHFYRDCSHSIHWTLMVLAEYGKGTWGGRWGGGMVWCTGVNMQKNIFIQQVNEKLQFKPQALHEFYTGISPSLVNCKKEMGSYLHSILHLQYFDIQLLGNNFTTYFFDKLIVYCRSCYYQGGESY